MNHNEDIRRPDSEEIKNKADSPDYPETILGIELEKPQDTPPREPLSPDKVFVNNYLDYVKQAAVELAKVTEITAKTWDKHLAEGRKEEAANFSQVNFEGSMLGWLDLPSVPKKAAQDISQSFQPVRHGGIDKHLNLDIPAKETTDLALNFEEGALPKSIAEKRSKAEILSSIVVAKAKLTTIRPLAESVYPTFKDKFSKFDKFFDEVAKAAIQEKQAKFSLTDILSNPRLQQAVISTLGISAVLAIGFLNSGCAAEINTPNPDASPTQPQVTEVMPTQQIIPTEAAPLPTAESTAIAEPILEPTATETPAEAFVFTGFESVITDPVELQKVNETNMTQEQINKYIEEFLNVDEASYRDWVTKYSFYNREETQFSPQNEKGEPISGNETVKRLGLLKIYKMKVPYGNFDLLSMQGVVLGTQYVFNESRGKVQSYVFLGIEDGVGNRSVIGYSLGDYDAKISYFNTSSSDSGHQVAMPTSEQGSVTNVVSITKEMYSRLGDAVIIQIRVPTSNISIPTTANDSGKYLIGMLIGQSGENAKELESQLIASYIEDVPAAMLLQWMRPLPITSFSEELDDFYVPGNFLFNKNQNIDKLFDINN